MATAAPPPPLSAPYTIFQLSQPLHQTRAKDREGGTYRACFISLVDSRKRGATEIAVAVDGEGVNIYDVRTTQIVSTYALPPATKFFCTPTSSFSRKSASFLRRTYAAVSLPKKQLLCWEEHGVASTEDKAEAINMLSRNGDSRHDVVFLQDLAAGRKRAEGLLAVYADGYVRCFSSDLKSQKWEFLAQSLSAAKKVTVVYAAATSLTIAKKAILKNHLDLVLPATDEETPEDTILFTVSHTNSTFSAHVFSIPASSSTPRELLLIPLPCKPEDTPSFSIHFPTATLTLLSPTTLTTLPLTSPSTPTTLPLPTLPSSHLRISPTTVLVSTPTSISLYDTKFTSLHSSTPSPPTTLTTHLPTLSLAIAHTPTAILALPLPSKHTLLIDSLSRGLPTTTPPRITSTTTSSTPASKTLINKLSSEHRRLATTLSRLSTTTDTTSLETAVQDYIGTRSYTRREPKALQHAFVDAVLKRVFSAEDGGLWSESVMAYLAGSGNLSGGMLQRGWVDVVAGWEGGLEKVEWVLGVADGVGVEELVAAVRVGVRRGVKGVVRRALVRLDMVPGGMVVGALKVMGGEELMGLVEVLRGELKGGEVDVGVLAGVLTAVVDTVGVGGMVVGGGEVVEGLYAEIAETVEAVEEAVGLKGILEEMFRHVKVVEGKKEKSGREEKRKGRRKERRAKRRVEVEGEAPGPDASEAQNATQEDTSKALVLAPAAPASKRKTRSARKLRVSRASSDARARHVARLETRRKPRRVSALLPLGLAPVVNVRIGAVEKGLGMGDEAEKREVDRKRGREAGIRESLVKGVYSVETMVV